VSLFDLLHPPVFWLPRRRGDGGHFLTLVQRKPMKHDRRGFTSMPDFRSIAFCAVALLGAAPVPAMAAPWWYVGRGADRVTFIDTGSVERAKGIVSYTSKTVIRSDGDPVAMTVNLMSADCAKRQLGWFGVQRFGYDDAVIDTSTRPHAEMTDVSADPQRKSELDFACSGEQAREAAGAFPLTIDDAAFAEALLADTGTPPRSVHDRMAADASVPVIRSTAPAPSTFGQTQTVALGEPMVPPRDYAKGSQLPDPKEYASNEVGTIYDVAYQGIKDGQIRFEVRGYSIDDLVHPGSGQIEPADPREKKIYIRDLAITIKAALPDRITYSVAIEKGGAAGHFCPPGGC
jgi:hypothetical protein